MCSAGAAAWTTTALAVSVLLVFSVDSAEAKRGCSSFGHSCYGGHGKRGMESRFSSLPEEVLLEPENPSGGDQAENYPDVVFTGPRTGSGAPGPALVPGSTRPIGRYLEPSSAMYNLSPFLRQWLQSYRNAKTQRPNM